MTYLCGQPNLIIYYPRGMILESQDHNVRLECHLFYDLF